MSGPQALVAIIGPPRAGKSRVGKQLARLLRVDFIDTDRRIVDKHGPIPTIFAERGERWFRAAERAEVAAALAERAVVSLGGGAVLDADTQRDLAGCRVALLTVSPEAVRTRISGSSRPLLTEGLESWTRIAEERRELYERLADRSWDSSNRSPVSLAHEIARWMRAEGGA